MRRLLRAIVVTLVAIVMFIGGVTFGSGWSSNLQLPDKFVFIRGVIDEPSNESLGAIYLWIRLDERPQEPFNIRLPYSDEMAREVHKLNSEVDLDTEIIITIDNSSETVVRDKGIKRTSSVVEI